MPHARIITWNVASLMSLLPTVKKNFGSFAGWLNSTEADVIAVQETKASIKDIPEDVACPDGWDSFWSFSTAKKGLNGVATFVRRGHLSTIEGISDPLDHELDAEGRCVIVRCSTPNSKKISIVNVYAPNSGERQKGRPRLEAKLCFFELLRKAVAAELLQGHEVILLGDLNAPHSHMGDLHPEVGRKGGGDGSRAMTREEAASEVLPSAVSLKTPLPVTVPALSGGKTASLDLPSAPSTYAAGLLPQWFPQPQEGADRHRFGGYSVSELAFMDSVMGPPLLAESRSADLLGKQLVECLSEHRLLLRESAGSSRQRDSIGSSKPESSISSSRSSALAAELIGEQIEFSPSDVAASLPVGQPQFKPMRMHPKGPLLPLPTLGPRLIDAAAERGMQLYTPSAPAQAIPPGAASSSSGGEAIGSTSKTGSSLALAMGPSAGNASNESPVAMASDDSARTKVEVPQAPFVDCWRMLHPTMQHQYTVWSWRTDARATNMGLRIDFIMVSPSLYQQAVRGCNVLNTHKKWSDHVAMDLYIDLGALEEGLSGPTAATGAGAGADADKVLLGGDVSKTAPSSSAASVKPPAGSAATWLRFKKRSSKLTAFFGGGAKRSRPNDTPAAGAAAIKKGKR